jgi:hypothetical protein
MSKIGNLHRGLTGSPFLIPIAPLSLVTGVAWFVSVRSPSLSSRQADAVAKSAAVPVPVIADQVRRADVPIYLEGIGVVRAFNTVTVRARVEGRDRQDSFQRGPGRQRRRSLGGDRPAAVSSAARRGQGQEGRRRRPSTPPVCSCRRICPTRRAMRRSTLRTPS